MKLDRMIQVYLAKLNRELDERRQHELITTVMLLKNDRIAELEKQTALQRLKQRYLSKIIKSAGVIALIVLMTSCATHKPPTSVDYMNVCRQVCRGNVGQYSDPDITCNCK